MTNEKHFYGRHNDTPHYIWSVGPMGDSEANIDTCCRSCAERIYGSMPTSEVDIVPDDFGESDYPVHCLQCDLLLDVSLTDYGLQYVRDYVLEALSDGKAIGLDEDSIVYQWHERYGQQIATEFDDSIIDPADVLQAYLVAQVWTGSISWMTGDYEHGGEEYTSDGLLDRYISTEELSADIIAQCESDVDAFLAMVGPYLRYWENAAELTAEQIGHDFSLTRNHHGAGFWDRGLGELGKWLTRCAQSFGSSSLYGSIELDPAGRDESGEWNIAAVLPDTLRVYLEG